MTILFDLSTPESRVLESFLIVSVSPSDQSAPPLAMSVPHCWVHEQLHSLLLRNWTLYSYIIASFVICDSCGLKSMLSNRSIAFYFLLVFPVAWTPFWTPYSQSTYVFISKVGLLQEAHSWVFCLFLNPLCCPVPLTKNFWSLQIKRTYYRQRFTNAIFYLFCNIRSFHPLMLSSLVISFFFSPNDFISDFVHLFLFGDYRVVHKTYL